MMFRSWIVLIFLIVSMPLWATNTYLETYKGKDVNSVKADLPAYTKAQPAVKSNVIYDVSTAVGGNLSSSNFSIEAVLAYKLTKNYHTGLGVYLYSYSESYADIIPERLNYPSIEPPRDISGNPASSAKLGSNAIVLAWYQEYQLTAKTKIFTQVGIPIGHNQNIYESPVESNGTWYNLSGTEYFNGHLTFDVGLKHYFFKSLYLGASYRFFSAEINVDETLADDYNFTREERIIKAGDYNNHSLLINIGYTFNAN